MKNLLVGLLVLGSISSFASTMVCGVYLIDINSNETLAHRTLEQSTAGMSGGTINGADLYIESSKRRFLRKPMVTSQVGFADHLYGGEKAIIQFYRDTDPNRNGYFQTRYEIGEEIHASVGEEKVSFIENKYIAKVYCTLKSEIKKNILI
jgi:hypothetical protein